MKEWVIEQIHQFKQIPSRSEIGREAEKYKD